MINAVPGQKLYCYGSFTHRGPAFDPYICIAFGKARHRELGIWPIVSRKASELGIIVNDDDSLTLYDFVVPIEITQPMVVSTFDVLRVIARGTLLGNASNLSSVRFDDDWDDDVVTVNTASASSVFGMGESGSYQLM